MKIHFYGILIAGLAISVQHLASAVIPCNGCRLVDKLAAAAVTGSSDSGIALALMERIAMGRTDEIPVGWEARAGIEEGEIQKTTDSLARERAFYQIETTGLPAAVEFLAKLTKSDLVPDGSGQDYERAASIALAGAQLKKIPNAKLQVEFLKAELMSKTARTPKDWSADQLCDRGAVEMLPEVKRILLRLNSGQRGQDNVDFCEARMRVAVRDTDRIHALATVFDSLESLLHTEQGKRLVEWALRSLDEIHSPDSDAEVDRFGLQADLLAKGNLSDVPLSVIRAEIGLIQKTRKR